jgi:hypothetical protein
LLIATGCTYSIKGMPRNRTIGRHTSITPNLPRVQSLLAISIVETARPGREGLGPGQTGRLPGRIGTRTGRLFQSSRTRPDDRLGSVGDMKLCHDVGNVVPHSLGCQCELGGDRGVVVTSRHHGQDLTLAIR